jgi:methanethiol S-methyltransferase
MSSDKLPTQNGAITCKVRAATKIVFATSAVVLLHSVLASHSAKQTAARVFGIRKRDVYYRPFYIAQSVISFGALAVYASRLPNRLIWKLGTGSAWFLNAMRTAALWEIFRAVRQIGFGRIIGLQKQKAGSSRCLSTPEAQGPNLLDGKNISGPFRYSRHPLNFLGLPLFWLTPRMTRNRFAFNCVATLYFVLGSLHEEHRLRLAYGERYERYTSETKFFFGRKQKKRPEIETAHSELV